MKIDFHGSFYPQFYLNMLAYSAQRPYLKPDENQRDFIHQNGFKLGPIVRAVWDIEKLLDDLDKGVTDKQKLSVSVLGVDSFDSKESVSLSRKIGNFLAEISCENPRPIGLA